MTREEKAYVKALRSRGVEVRRDYSTPELQKGKPEDPYKDDFGVDFNALANPQAAVDNTKVDVPNKDFIYYNQSRRKADLESRGTVREVQPRNKVAKALDIAANPVQAASYAIKGQTIPDYLPEGDNPIDMALDMVNPAAWANYAEDAAAQTSQGNIIGGGFTALGAIPGVKIPGVTVGAKTLVQPVVQKASQKLGDLNKLLLPEYKKLHKIENVYADMPGGVPPAESLPIKRNRKIPKVFPNIRNIFRNTDDLILEKRMAAQDEAFGSGVDFAERWAYDLDAPGQPLREGYLQKIHETIAKNSPSANYLTDADIAKEAAKRAEKNMNWAANNPDSDLTKKLFYPEGPMGKSENILTTWPNESNPALLKKDPYDFASSGIDKDVQDFMDRDYYVRGFKTFEQNPKPHFETSAVTFRKAPRDTKLRDPEGIKATGTHEGHHNQQLILEWINNLKASIQSSPTLKDNPLAYRIKKAMKADQGPDASGDYDWFAQLGELHSELGVARMELADAWVKAGRFKNRNEVIDFMQSPEFLNNDKYIKRLYDRLGGKSKNLITTEKHADRFFKEKTPMKDRLDILRGLPAAVPVVGVGAAAASTSEMQRGGDEGVALDPAGEVFLEQDKGVRAKEARVSKRAARKEQKALAKKMGDLRRARNNENVQWLLYNIYKHESDKDAQGNVNLGGFNQSAGDSSAFGSGQFIGDTRNSVLEKYGVDAWSIDPIEQEMASIALLEMNGLLKDVKKGKFKGNALTERVKVKDKSKPEGFRMDVQNWEAFVDDNKSRLIDKPKKKAETREWRRKLGTYRQNARYAPEESFSKIKPEVQSEKADLYKRNYEGIWPTGETVAPQGIPAVDFVMPGDTSKVRQQEVLITAPKYREGGVESFNPNSKENLAYAKALRKSGVKVSSTGYKHDSPDRNNAANLIVGDNVNGTNLTMQGVPHGVRATGVDTGKTVDMIPGVKNYSFPQDRSVMEVPLYRNGGREIPEYQYGGSLSNMGFGSETNDMIQSTDVPTKAGKPYGDPPPGGGGGAFGAIVGDIAAAAGAAAVVGRGIADHTGLQSQATVAEATGSSGQTQATVDSSIDATVSAIPMAGQFYQLGSAIGDGVDIGRDAFLDSGNEEGADAMSAVGAVIHPGQTFGKNAELYESGYMTEEEGIMNMVLTAIGGGAFVNMGLDQKTREIAKAKAYGGQARATGGMHQAPPAAPASKGKFRSNPGYPKSS